MELVKNETPEIKGKRIYYCIAGYRTLAIPSVNIIKDENGEIRFDTAYGIEVRQHPLDPRSINISLAPITNARVRWNMLVELEEADPIYQAVIQQMSGIIRPH